LILRLPTGLLWPVGFCGIRRWNEVTQEAALVTPAVTLFLESPAPVRTYLDGLSCPHCDIFRRTRPSYTRTHTRIHTYERYRGGAFFGKCHSSIYNKYIKYILTLEERERKICHIVRHRNVTMCLNSVTPLLLGFVLTIINLIW